ncbi:L-lactate permease [Saccharopolyspora phatthalungensis]|uniref:L-lactate permease n=1 Tax=Saccharopolyspora phatthalungensis TaxID=664693 RepID=A0A840QI29_9PSEU|nr:L-lactate permease [Saccharopolyspora phatthalungensis]MBB5159877.1 lactate permease [Saccharopolyspora phatthalungensis]
MLGETFSQILDPLSNVVASTLLALVPVVVLLVLLTVFRLGAWQAVSISAVVTVVLASTVWRAPLTEALTAYGLGAATGFWSIDWIVFWGVVIYNTLVVTGAFRTFQRWLVAQSTADIRVQTLLIAWAFGALLEGLVGFGYPWAVVAPLLIGFGIADLASIRVAALANNAPVSFGALGAPLIGLAAVTGLPLAALSASVGKIVAILALAPPWLLIYLVSGKRGLKDGWPLAIVGSLGYIAGQFPTSQYLGPYLPDIIGSLVCFAALLLLLRVWRPRVALGFGGKELTAEEIAAQQASGTTDDRSDTTRWTPMQSLVPFLILIGVVVAWTGPWSVLTKYVPFKPEVSAISSLSHKTTSVSWEFAPFVAGTAILVCWLLTAAYLRPDAGQLRQVFRNTFRQMWGALLVGPLIFGLAQVFNYSGMANSMAEGFAKVGVAFVVLSALLGWIAVALSGSNTTANALFGQFQYSVALLLHAPVLLFPSLNSLGAEVGKPVAPQTASVGVSTTRFVRNEGEVIRYNMGWTLVLLVYLIAIGVFFYFVIPGAVTL